MDFLASFLKGMSTVIVLGVIVAALLNASIVMSVREKSSEYQEVFKHSNALSACSSDESSELCAGFCSDSAFKASFPGCCDKSEATPCRK